MYKMKRNKFYNEISLLLINNKYISNNGMEMDEGRTLRKNQKI